MKTIYTLIVRPSTRIPAGNLFLNVGGERTFYFSKLSERQKALDWIRAQGWPVITGSIESLMTGEEAIEDIKRDIERTCKHFDYPVPAELIA